MADPATPSSAAKTASDTRAGNKCVGDDRTGNKRTGRATRRKRISAKSASSLDRTARHANLYDEVTQRIIADLETDRIPWVQPWRATVPANPDASAGVAPALPRNALTGRAYSGINILTLWGALIERSFASQHWLTFKQALEAGGCVRKGERGTTIVYADRFVPRDRGEATIPPTSDSTAIDARTVPFLKRFTVFNIAQCDGLPPDFARAPAPLPEREIVPVAERLIAASEVDFRIGGNRAFYVPSQDFIAVPPQPAFHDQINYYRTCLHELTHATGHPSRLGRKLVTAFGTKDYAREELVAEMGSAFLCAALGIVPTVRHADYIAAWLDLLRADNRAIFRAASAASKAADWLLTRHAAAAAAAVSDQSDAEHGSDRSPPHAREERQ